MPTIDFTSAYSDASRGSTLKALAARRAELQAAIEQSQQPRQIGSATQAIAQVADTISGSIREGRAARQEAAGRQQFAQLLAGGLTPDEIGQAMNLDPETTMAYVKHGWDTDATKAAADAHAAELSQSHDWDVQAALDRIQAEKDAQTALFSHEDTAAGRAHDLKVEDVKTAAATASDSDLRQAALRGDNKVAIDEAVKRGLLQPEEATQMNAQIDARAAAAAPDKWEALTPEDIARYGPDSEIAKNSGAYQIDRKTGEVKRVDPNAFAFMSPAAKEQDVQSAKQDVEWASGGKQQYEADKSQLDKAFNDLTAYQNDPSSHMVTPGFGAPSGLVTSAIGAAGPFGDLINRGLNKGSNFLNMGTPVPDPVTTRDLVRNVAQSSLKAVLGSQYTEREGVQVLERAYDPGATTEDNLRRIKLLRDKLAAIAAFNDARSAWLRQYKTMDGFTGPTLAENKADLLNTNFDEGATTPAAGGRTP